MIKLESAIYITSKHKISITFTGIRFYIYEVVVCFKVCEPCDSSTSLIIITPIHTLRDIEAVYTTSDVSVSL